MGLLRFGNGMLNEQARQENADGIDGRGDDQ